MMVCSSFLSTCKYFFQAVSPTLEQINAVLLALELPLPTKDTSVFSIFSQIESKVSESNFINIIFIELYVTVQIAIKTVTQLMLNKQEDEFERNQVINQYHSTL